MIDEGALRTSVLVVDDEPQVVWVLQFSLEAEGYTTFAARDGRQALTAIAEHHPKLMLLDLMMPTLDGWSVLEEMMQLPREERPRVVVVSAMANLRPREGGGDGGGRVHAQALQRRRSAGRAAGPGTGILIDR